MKWLDLHALKPLKINLGGGRCHHPLPAWSGWVSVGLRRPHYPEDGWWVEHEFPAPMDLPDACVDVVASEHFLEHLDAADAEAVIADVLRVLVPGGRFRVAVPDMLHPGHRESLAAGRDLGPHDHRSMWTCPKLVTALFEAGFTRIEPLHFWDASGRFVMRPIDYSVAHLFRTPEHDSRNYARNDAGELCITSLVVDACKPESERTATLVGQAPQRTVAWDD